MRGRAEVAYQGHSLGVAGSIPAPAIYQPVVQLGSILDLGSSDVGSNPTGLTTTPASVFYTFVHGTKNNISEALGHERNPETFGVF